jgi:hypothetical protein
MFQVQCEGDRLIYTSQPFPRTEAQSWWLCYETLQTVDTELRRADNLNADLRRERFAARGVRGIEEPNRLVELIPTNGWLPVDARVRVGHVAALVSKLGGHELYGDDQSVPLRELIQNAADAVRARRILEALAERWGSVHVRTGTDENGPWVEVEDNGVGMSTEVLTGPLLDFGVSYWSTPDAVVQFPRLLARGFHSTGRYGIGFFSVFMWADRVRVTTRRYDEAVRDTRVLEFEQGLNIRPLLRPAEPAEWVRDGGTRVRVWPRGVSDIDGNWIQLESTLRDFDFDPDFGKADPISVARWLCLTLDVDLIAQAGSGEPVTLVIASDWLDMPGEMLLDRTEGRPRRSGITKTIAGSNIRPLMHNGRVVGRACISPHLKPGCVAVGGFRVGTSVSVAGVFLGESTRASREEATVLVSPEELARWATEQSALIASANLPAATQAKCARLIGLLGGVAGSLALAKVGGTWLRSEALVEWCRAQESIIIIDEADERRALEQHRAILRSNVLVEPNSANGLYVIDYLTLSSRLHRGGRISRDATKVGQRPVLEAIAAAWAPIGIQVWRGEHLVDADERLYLEVENVRREDDEIS